MIDFPGGTWYHAGAKSLILHGRASNFFVRVALYTVPSEEGDAPDGTFGGPAGIPGTDLGIGVRFAGPGRSYHVLSSV